MTRRRLLILSLVVTLLPSWVMAQDVEEAAYRKNIKVFQPKPILESNRLEMLPFASVTLNPNMMQYYGAGGFIGWHFTESFFAGVQFTQFLSVSTDTKDQVENDFGLFPERTEIGYLGTARVAWTPLFAKSAVFGSFLSHWNAYIFAGGGVIRTKLTDLGGAGEFGIGTRFFLADFLALTLELSDTMYMESFMDGSQLMQNVMLRAGLSLYIPFTFEYGE